MELNLDGQVQHCHGGNLDRHDWNVHYHGGIACISSLQTPIHKDIHTEAGGRRPAPFVDEWIGKEEIGNPTLGI